MLSKKEFAAHDPHWYVVAANILKALGEDVYSYNKFIDDGLEKHPYYYQLYFSAIDYLAPKWHGDKHQIETFANRAVVRTKPTEGMGLYARIYWYASQTQYSERIFLDSDVVWRKMKEGIYDVIDEYPDSWNIQNFALFSCLAGDQETTRMLFDNISDPILIQAWKNPEYYNFCRSFAYPIVST